MNPTTIDNLLARVLGKSLNDATMRLVAGALVLAALVSLIIWVI